MDPGGARGTRRHVVCFKSEIPEIFVRPLLAPLVALPGEQGVQLCCKVLELVKHNRQSVRILRAFLIDVQDTGIGTYF